VLRGLCGFSINERRQKGMPIPHFGETRYRAMGRNAMGRPLFVVFALRRIGEDMVIRPISARYAHKKEAMRWPAN
jgi:uncharacterized DUF497 family protein